MNNQTAKKGSKIALRLGAIFYLFINFPVLIMLIFFLANGAKLDSWPDIVWLLIYWLIGSSIFIVMAVFLVGIGLNYFFKYRENIYKNYKKK
ncbi:hypothetical protein [Candidatus Leptofilum sp.]|uniref:hypothetical protein n=1 Tax=Candidatus Leptofilum sp. TaxID=3241576 RepID=UPI003B5C00F2